VLWWGICIAFIRIDRLSSSYPDTDIGRWDSSLSVGRWPLSLYLVQVTPTSCRSRSTQPCIPPGSLSRVPASPGVRRESHRCRVAGSALWSNMTCDFPKRRGALHNLLHVYHIYYIYILCRCHPPSLLWSVPSFCTIIWWPAHCYICWYSVVCHGSLYAFIMYECSNPFTDFQTLFISAGTISHHTHMTE